MEQHPEPTYRDTARAVELITITEQLDEAVAAATNRNERFATSFSTGEEYKSPTLKAFAVVSLGLALAASTGLQVRGGNYKVVRQNLQDQGKLNAKEKMSPEQKKIRQRKRKK
ncbi:MAG: hypothetical protein ABI602_02710 [Candidatus Saccharibacteria bacterium]